MRLLRERKDNMPKMVCVKCEIEFRAEENGVHVHELMSNDTAIYKIWDADLWRCPGCGIMVVAGFAQNPFAEHFETERMQAILASEKAHLTTIILDREHLKKADYAGSITALAMRLLRERRGRND
jgi:rubredoxin